MLDKYLNEISEITDDITKKDTASAQDIIKNVLALDTTDNELKKMAEDAQTAIENAKKATDSWKNDKNNEDLNKKANEADDFAFNTCLQLYEKMKNSEDIIPQELRKQADDLNETIETLLNLFKKFDEAIEQMNTLKEEYKQLTKTVE